MIGWAIVIFLLLVLMVVLSLDNSWNNVTQEERNDIVFKSKNKNYGAFTIRKEYSRTLMLALGASCAFLLVAIAGPAILAAAAEEPEEKIVSMDEVKLVEPPPTNKEELPPPPPPPPPPPMIKQIQFTVPEVTEEVVEEIPPSQEEVKDTKIGETTQEGEEGDPGPIDPGEGVGGEDNTIFTTVEQQPEFPGGEEALLKYLQSNAKFPLYEQENGIQGTVYINFVVDKDGSVTEVKEVRGVKGGPGLTKEAIRVVKTLPKFKPGKQGGRPVRVYYNVPVRFTIR